MESNSRREEELRLEIHGLHKEYGNNVVALDQACAVFKPGITGLVGSNGAGKSTLIKLLAQLERPSRGAITLGQQNATADPGVIRRTLGLLPQHFGVYEQLTPRQFLRYLAAVKRVENRKIEPEIDDLLARLNLTQVQDSQLKTFSGGMRQRVGIAQALLGTPDIVIFDEPTVGLDPLERVSFRKLLTDLAKSKIVILSSHIVSDIASLADQIMVLNKGHVSVFDTPERLLGAMANRVWSVPIAEQELASFERDFMVCDVDRHSLGLTLRVVADVQPTSAAKAVAPNLEDAYLCFSRADALEVH
ncbi:ATP-binding cassette domain-containing protein [Shewanella salipaludis]|uniref:ATP-binding cassette domain-containing protein n=1 Tax=Shewanella salipaludis TaxID=2723052 RepID=A0A972G0P2_9GAMM|nr:ATP-binding cassette domain-containing protein [Shewanella salipaludis]NMH66673.1 ATP-binding cassette domain-containing protein [Shewanella salipaludis]